ncbi:Gp37 family protein [Parasegetibacter sp. NRK P23]|uniref:Gp37 family protein n=1 Tax=Parasegetibacter sp. NRK P23 TaxID=2942999 RepID=UPI00204356ED|nr:Gp37 family protein [Parasegetibacter sp. NRK P23]MCM5528963.1 Gp37 family protein [Parasegetibacter sp. NRK P23]
MNLYPSQQSIVQKLQSDFTGAGTSFVARDLPDSPGEVLRGVANPVVYVAYTGSISEPPLTTNTIAQRRKVTFAVECIARTLYGENGMNAVRDIVEQSIVGFKPSNCQRLYLKKDNVTQSENGEAWVHVYEFECDTILVQKEESDPIIVPSFKELVHPE